MASAKYVNHSIEKDTTTDAYDDVNNIEQKSKEKADNQYCSLNMKTRDTTTTAQNIDGCKKWILTIGILAGVLQLITFSIIGYLLSEMIMLKDDLRSVKMDNEDLTARQDIVAFSVHSPTTSSLSRDSTVMYGTVETNIGGHFDSQSSVFTCPLTGIYMLHITVTSQPGENVALEIKIDNDDVAIAYADGDHSDDYEQGSTLAFHRCSAGARVQVVSNSTGGIHQGFLTSFSGVFIKRL